MHVDTESGIGKINANGLKRDGNAYVNDAYGESEVTLLINIEAGVGDINLELGEYQQNQKDRRKDGRNSTGKKCG